MLVDIPGHFDQAVEADHAIKLVYGPKPEELTQLAANLDPEEPKQLTFGAIGRRFVITVTDVRTHPSIKGSWWIAGRLPSDCKVYVLWHPGFGSHGFIWIRFRPICRSAQQATCFGLGLTI
jgi:hypothetical protein